MSDLSISPDSSGYDLEIIARTLHTPIRCTPETGRYEGADVLGALDLAEVFKDYPEILRQVERSHS
jgi:hypothetical protein